MARKTENNSELDKLLHSISGLLRHELSRLKIMGEIPKIQFVAGLKKVLCNFQLIQTTEIVLLDKTYSNIAAVDRLLNEADFGKDFVPTCPTLLNNHPTVFTKIDPKIKVTIIKDISQYKS